MNGLESREEPQSRAPPPSLRRFVHELRQRNVFKVAAAYAVAGWLLIEITTQVFPVFNFPQWTIQFVVLVVLLGFPLALILAWAFEVTPDGIMTAANAQTPPEFAAATGQRLNHVILTLVVLAVGFLFIDRYMTGASARTISLGTAAPPKVQRLSMTLPENQPVQIRGFPTRSLALSQDGQQVVYIGADLDPPEGQRAGRAPLQLRNLASRSVLELPGTVDANQPFFSPDGQWVAYFTGRGELRKVAVTGGNPLTVVEQINGSNWASGVWTPDDTIIYSEGTSALQQVAADGGNVTPLTVLDEAQQETEHRNPSLVPGQQVVLFTVMMNGLFGEARIDAVLIESGERRRVLDNAYAPEVLGSGHLLFHRDGAVMVAPFDLERVAVSGPAIPLAEDMMFDGPSRRPLAELAVSSSGTLAYVPGAERSAELGLMSRDGNFAPLPLAPNYISLPRVAPDGHTVAFRVSLGSDSEIHTFDVARGSSNRLTLDDEYVANVAYHPDGRSLLLGEPNEGLWLQRPDGPRQLLVEEPANTLVRNADWSPDGTALAYTVQSGSGLDIWLATPGEPATNMPLFATSAVEHSPAFSPDGNWLAYVSNESGRDEVYLSQYPQGERLTVSIAGGNAPLWSPDGSELFFTGLDSGVRKMMAIKLTQDDGNLLLSRPEHLFDLQVRDAQGRALVYPTGSYLGNGFDILPDGRFVMLRLLDTINTREIVLVQNWFDELNQLAPVAVGEADKK